ncbi:GNAT family N-acetyltransferase [Candidatus Micrarchaeota archaeon]|nr:GNAT family N-acetyltransferase [Candidatus Micrarchaeota archaeon]
MKIRKAKKADLENLAELSHELFKNQIKNCSVDFRLKKNFRSIQKKEFLEKLRDKTCVFFVAEVGKELAGFVLGHTERESGVFENRLKGNVDQFYVRESFRGKGIGKKLFAQIKEWFKKKKAPSIRIHVAKCNVGAKRMYESLGFGPAQFEQLVLKL